MKRIFDSFVIGFLVSLLFCCSQASPDISQIKNEIQTVLDEQKESWNAGNIGGFMEYYWKSEDFTFQSGDKRLNGWEALLARYEESYSGEKMGKLDFTDIDIRVQSQNFAYVLGRWKLVFKDSSKEGLFTIIFKRLPEGWRIIHDHTSY
jgi:beta-aspartyl-peptidase (threonine type)